MRISTGEDSRRARQLCLGFKTCVPRLCQMNLRSPNSIAQPAIEHGNTTRYLSHGNIFATHAESGCHGKLASRACRATVDSAEHQMHSKQTCRTTSAFEIPQTPDTYHTEAYLAPNSPPKRSYNSATERQIDLTRPKKMLHCKNHSVTERFILPNV